MKISSYIIDRSPDLARIQDSLTDILNENKLCTIATVNHDGTPHAKTSYFAVDDDLHIYILTPPASRSGQNVTQNPNVSITVFDSRQEWGSPHRGAQLFGSCYQAYGKELEESFMVYTARFPQMTNLAETIDDLTLNLESRLYVIYLSSAHVIDEPRYGPETSFTVQIERP